MEFKQFKKQLQDHFEGMVKDAQILFEVDIDKLEEARNYELYVEDSYLKFAKRIKLIDKRKLKEGD